MARGQSVQVQYSKPTGTALLQDVTGNPVESIGATTGFNHVGKDVPRLVRCDVPYNAGNKVTLLWTHELAAGASTTAEVAIAGCAGTFSDWRAGNQFQVGQTTVCAYVEFPAGSNAFTFKFKYNLGYCTTAGSGTFPTLTLTVAGQQVWTHTILPTTLTCQELCTGSHCCGRSPQ